MLLRLPVANESGGSLSVCVCVCVCLRLVAELVGACPQPSLSLLISLASWRGHSQAQALLFPQSRFVMTQHYADCPPFTLSLFGSRHSQLPVETRTVMKIIGVELL